MDLVAGAAFAVAASDDRAANARVAEDCRAARIPVNCADAPAECDFYFPAVITEGDITVAVSTGGASPALAAALKAYIAKRLPAQLQEICAKAAKWRGIMSAEEYKTAVKKLLEEDGA